MRREAMVVEELHVLGTVAEHVREDPFQERLSQRHVVREIEERHLRLDHPELGEVPRGVRVLGAEGRAEGVDLRHRQAEALDVELAGDGEEGLLAEKVLRRVHMPVLRHRRVREVLCK